MCILSERLSFVFLNISLHFLLLHKFMRSKRPLKNDVILQVRPVHIVSKSLLFYFFVRSDNWSDSAERSHCWQRQITHTSQSID